jgi:two-component system chemotaxis sensor kinase CheA
MIEDAALRELFRAESEEHLQHLDDALLQLEKEPTDQPLLEEAFREAHSLKGAARMLGLTAIQTPAHRLEDQFNAARRNTAPINAELLAQMTLTLNELRALTRDALARGEAKERSAQSALTGSAEPTVSAPVAPRPLPTQAKAAPAPAPEAPAAAPYQIESVRVDTKRLDALLTHASELAVTSTRFAQRLADVDALIDLNEDGARNRREPSALAATQQRTRLDATLARLRADFSEDSARLHTIAEELDSGIRRIRLLPLSNVFRLFPRLVHDLGQEQGKAVELLIEGEETNADKRILEEIKDPLMHMLRNAVDHGIEPAAERARAGKPETGSVKIRASQSADSVVIEVSDDGRGLDQEAIKHAALERGLTSQDALDAMSPEQIHALIFAAGMSTASRVTEVSGRGVGMSVVSANVQRLKGTIALASTPGRGTRFTITLPLTISTLRVLLVGVNGHAYGLPLQCVQSLRTLTAQDVFTLEGHSAILHQAQPILAAGLADLLELPGAKSAAPSTGVVFSVGSDSFGVFVDALLGEQEVMLKPQSALLERVRNVAGATILGNGEICMVLNEQDLAVSIRQGAAAAALATSAPAAAATPAPKKVRSILLAEDSPTMLAQELRILEGAGYEVVSAVDGQQAWAKLSTCTFDAIVTDVLMPNLDGLGLAARIRSDAKYAALPIILLTSLSSDEDKRRGLNAGADAYLTKSAFDQQVLLDCLSRLIL